MQYRLIRAVVDSLPLTHYAPLADRPGFIQVLQRLIGELKAARVHPDDFAQAVQTLGDEPRLAELAQIYAAYQARLQAQGWADRAGLGWLAVEALEQRVPDVGQDWPLLAVDGFDSFTPIQAALLQALAGRVGELVVTLTGEPDGGPITLAHRRFAKTRVRVGSRAGYTRRAAAAYDRTRGPPPLTPCSRPPRTQSFPLWRRTRGCRWRGRADRGAGTRRRGPRRAALAQGADRAGRLPAG